MKRIHTVILLAAALLVPLAASAQKARRTAVRKAAKVVAPPEPQEDPRLEEMRQACQQVTFIDSIVVDKQSLLDHYRLGTEAGTLHAYNQFFNTDGQPYSVVFLNELRNKAYFSLNGRLCTSDLLGSQWSEPAELEGLGRFQRQNYPFMLADGMTLYFAATGPESIGGLDIFVSRFDSGEGRFFKSENVGMPFNSEANDYMMAISETDSIGYFATDRNQPEGKACIYVFIPNQTRRAYDADELSDEQLRRLAEIHCIADTWGDDSHRRDEALQRLAALRSAQPAAAATGQHRPMAFIVSDQLTYTSPDQFCSANGRRHYEQLLKMQQRLEELDAKLQKSRLYYASASEADRTVLADEIRRDETAYYQLELDVRQLAKSIRNDELTARRR